MKKLTFLLLAIIGFSSCHQKRRADIIFYNGVVYTVNSGFSIVEAFVVRDGKIHDLGNSKDLLEEYDAPEKIDLKGRAVYPGFIDSHCHFYGYSTDLLKCDLYETKSFDEVIEKLQAFAKTNSFGWILGRGWDQNDWPGKAFPDKSKLDSLFPTTPVYLMRIDGHAALCNSAALKLAGVSSSTKLDGGELILINDQLTGILIDNAVDLVKTKIPPFTPELVEKALLDGQRNCFEVGLTTVDDAGLEKDSIETIYQLQKAGKLKIRVYAMLSDSYETLSYFFKNGTLKTERLNVRSVKMYADGALGSRGALLKKPYSDAPGHYGFLLHPIDYFSTIAEKAMENGFQVCTHAIGDSANKLMLNMYAKVLKGENNRRWRIEHCQIVSKKDRHQLVMNNIIPSVQPTHATSDMYWVEERIGKERMAEGYAYKELKNEAGDMIVFGTDFPVERINPIYTFYAAVARKDLEGFPEHGFQKENAVKKKDALRAMTIWGAYGNFEELEKGSIEESKVADFVILDQDIMQIDENRIPLTKVVATYVNGELVFGDLK